MEGRAPTIVPLEEGQRRRRQVQRSAGGAKAGHVLHERFSRTGVWRGGEGRNGEGGVEGEEERGRIGRERGKRVDMRRGQWFGWGGDG